MKIFIARIMHETNVFAPGITDVARFSTGAYCHGAALREKYAGTRHYLGGMMARADEEGADTVLSISLGTAGPIIQKSCLDYFVDLLMDDLIPCAHELDGICLSLHGSGVAEDVHDMEGYILRRIRSVVGMDMPIMASLDLHANLTAEMLKLCDGWFSIKKYPHTDTYEAGYKAMDCLMRCIKTGKKPVMTAYRLPLISMCYTTMRTDCPGPAYDIRRLVDEKTCMRGIWDAAFLHGFAHADIPTASMCALVVADEAQDDLALEIANFAWEKREAMYEKTLDVEPALDAAMAAMEPGKLSLLLEGSDHGGAGGPNDGTFVLQELLKRDPPKSILVSICDPEVAAGCCAIGVGGYFTGLLGGKADSNHGKSVMLENAQILGISDGHFRYTTPMYYGQPYCVGNTVRLKQGNVEIVVNSVPRQTHDDCMIAVTGGDINDYELVCGKGALAPLAFFSQIPQFGVVYTYPPGSCSVNIKQFTFSQVSRPIYPLDRIVEPIFRCLK